MTSGRKLSRPLPLLAAALLALGCAKKDEAPVAKPQAESAEKSTEKSAEKSALAPAKAEKKAPENAAETEVAGTDAAARAAGAVPAEAVARARAAVAPLKKSLKAALVGAMKEKGPVGAIEVCQVEAPKLHAAASEGGAKVGRTSHKLRNPANAPAEWMTPLLEELRTAPKSPDAWRAKRLDDGRIGYVEAIYTGGLCLNCHGENLNPAVKAKLAELYPKDEATGFAEGEFRGLFWVELPGS